MTPKDYFTSVAVPNINEMRADTARSFRRAWNAATSLDQVADHVAMEQLGYKKEWLRTDHATAVAQIIDGNAALQELRGFVSNPMKHVRSHRADAKDAGYFFLATTSAVETMNVRIKRGDGSELDYDAVLKIVEATEQFWRKHFGL